MTDKGILVGFALGVLWVLGMRVVYRTFSTKPRSVKTGEGDGNPR